MKNLMLCFDTKGLASFKMSWYRSSARNKQYKKEFTRFSKYLEMPFYNVEMTPANCLCQRAKLIPGKHACEINTPLNPIFIQ